MATIAVTGAAGRLGSQVTALLAPLDHDVIALTRRAVAPSAGASVRLAAYDDRRALRRALAGVDTLVLVSSDGPSETVLSHHLNVIAAALDAEVSQVVALSSLDADAASPFCYAVVNALTEEALRDSGIGFTAVRASIYSEFFASFVGMALPDGELRVPAGDGRISLVSRADVGRCLAALAVRPPTGAAYDVTGPAALSMDDVAATAGLTYSPLTDAAFVRALSERESPWWIYAYSSMFASVRQGR